jgi:hypothetical protein
MPMQKIGGSFELTATDLVGYLNCRHLSELDRAVAEGRIPKPKAFDPLLQILWERGAAHERNYIDHLMQAGLDVVRIDGIGDWLQTEARFLADRPKAEIRDPATLSPDEHQAGCFALEEERGQNWKGTGATRSAIKEAQPSL